jgi:transposase
MLTRPDLSRLSVAEKDALILALFDQVESLMQTVQAMQQRIDVLEGQLRKDSHNSHKPPSSDGLRKKVTQSLRKPSGRKPGGQTGHGGSTLEFTQLPDEVIVHPLASRCQRCGQPLQTQGLTVIRRQIIDLIKPEVRVTEHQGYETHCTCGQHHGSEFPAEAAAPVQYGSLLKGAMVYLNQQQLLPLARTAQTIQDLYGVNLSVGTVHACITQAAERLTPSHERIAQAIREQPVAHFDETGQRVAVHLRWLHVAGTALLTWYFTHDKRGQQAMDEAGILRGFKGVAVHDGLASYRDYDCTHALCNAHHLRELIYLEESTHQPWTRAMIDFLCAAKQEADEARSQQMPIGRRRLIELRQTYEVILEQGEKANPASSVRKGARGRVKQTPAVNLLRRLRQHGEDVLRFLEDLAVPFDNNQAERDIRMAKLKQKTSGCFRTLDGAHNFAVIRSYIATLRKQGRDVFAALVGVFQHRVADPLAA